MEQLILRFMDYDDVPAVVAVCRKSFGKHVAPRKKYLDDTVSNWRYFYFVAELDGKIVACTGARVADWFEDYEDAKTDTAKIEIVAVDPDYHGQGIGTKLFTKLIDTLEERGVVGMALSVHPSNTPAIEFYEHFGFNYHEIPRPIITGRETALMTRIKCAFN